METILSNKKVYALCKTLEKKLNVKMSARTYSVCFSIKSKNVVSKRFLDFKNGMFVDSYKDANVTNYFDVSVDAEKVIISGYGNITLSLKEAFDKLDIPYLLSLVEKPKSRCETLNKRLEIAKKFESKYPNILHKYINDIKDESFTDVVIATTLIDEYVTMDGKQKPSVIYTNNKNISIYENTTEIVVKKETRSNYRLNGTKSSTELDNTDKADWSDSNEITYVYENWEYDSHIEYIRYFI